VSVIDLNDIPYNSKRKSKSISNVPKLCYVLGGKTELVLANRAVCMRVAGVSFFFEIYR